MSSNPKAVANVAVVGCGGWTQGWHLPNLANRTDAKIVALVDTSDAPGVGGCVPSLCVPMAQLEQKYGAKRYKTIEDALADTSLALDGVLVAVPHAHHCSVGSTVLKAGLHLLMEKPMTADIDDARSLLSLAMERPTQGFLLNNTANWQPGSIAAYEAVSSGKIGEVRLVNCVFAAPLGWLFEGDDHSSWTQKSGSMKGNGFGWGQFSHTFAWVFKVTGLIPAKVYASCSKSAKSGADLYDSVVITCTNGCTINASGVGSCPDKGFKVVGNWIFGTEGMLSYCGLAGSDNVQLDVSDVSAEAASGQGAAEGSGPRLELWQNDGTHHKGPPVEFEHLDQGGTGPGSMDAWIAACRGVKDYYVGAGPVEGIKSVAAIDAMYRSAVSGQPEAVVGCDGL